MKIEKIMKKIEEETQVEKKNDFGDKFWVIFHGFGSHFGVQMGSKPFPKRERLPPFWTPKGGEVRVFGLPGAVFGHPGAVFGFPGEVVGLPGVVFGFPGAVFRARRLRNLEQHRKA